MISFSTTSRSTQAEIMDDFELKGDEMKQLLTDLKTVNNLLGGCSITKNGIEKLLRFVPKETPITIIDIGCGDGEMLRNIAKFGKKKGVQFTLIGVDANPYILEEARQRSAKYATIEFRNVDIFSNEFSEITYDIALCTLFLHHFKEDGILSILDIIVPQAKVGVVINDLERNFLAFQLFKVFGAVFLKTKIAKHDGLVSVARSFKKRDLLAISSRLKNVTSSIQWKWAFRWQWILKSNTS